MPNEKAKITYVPPPREAEDDGPGGGPSGKKRKNRWRFLLRFLGKTAAIVLVAWAATTWVLGAHRATGNAMFPAVRDGDLVVAYRLEDPYTGDAVLYRRPNGRLAVGRVVATPGQTIDFPEAGGYLVDGYGIPEDVVYETHPAEGGVQYPLALGEDEYFVLNDFRTDMNDSRVDGPVGRDAIVGKLLFLLRRRGF